MTRKEYMDLLSRALENVEPEVARDIMEDYEAHFERAKESGRSDEEVIDELGSIEEFTEELNAFMTGKNTAAATGAQNPPSDGTQGGDFAADAQQNVTENEPAIDKNVQEKDETMATAEDGNHKQAEWYQQKAEEELERARAEMNHAYEEMRHAKEELERAKQERERIQQEAAWEQEERKQKQQKDRMHAAGGTVNLWDFFGGKGKKSDSDGIVDSAKNLASSVLNQVSGAMDKAFSGFGDWMAENFEKSGEDVADYRRRQENAKAEADEYRRERSENTGGMENGKYGGTVNSYHFDFDEDGEQYMPECVGIVDEQEGIRHLVVDSKSAEVEIHPSEDGSLFYRYTNEGSAGSKIVYQCRKSISHGTMTLSIVQDEKAGHRSHSSILGGVFGENADLHLELRLPKWLEVLEVNGKSGDITMEDVPIRTLMLKSMSGDITLRRVNADKCMTETMSGDVEVKDGEFGHLLATSKSGDVKAQRVRAEKAAFKSMSGDGSAQDCEFGEAVVSSMSGDAYGGNGKSRVISVSSMSGDASLKGMSVMDAKISAVSGDVQVSGVAANTLLMTVTSGDMEGNELNTKVLKASCVSGDMSIRGHAEQMSLNNGSGDIIVVQNGDTRALVSTRSGEVHFHLKNDGAGFAAKVSTHGETRYRYQGLNLGEAANGIHRYGAEGSSLEIKSISGDISITD